MDGDLASGQAFTLPNKYQRPKVGEVEVKDCNLNSTLYYICRFKLRCMGKDINFSLLTSQ